MEHVKGAVKQTRVAVSMPPKWLNMYSDFITKNAGAVGQIEGALRSLTYIIPGRFRESEVASETLHSSVQVLSLYHDSLLSRALALSLKNRSPRQQTPHSRYTRFYSAKSPTYRRTATTLQVLQYTELLVEMLAKRRGEKARWNVVVLLEMIKALCRLFLLRLTNSRPLLNPPLPEREMPDEPTLTGPPDPDLAFTANENPLPSPQSENSLAGSEQWTMPRTSLTLPPLPTSEDISSYLLSKVLTAEDIKPAKNLLHRTSGLSTLAEILYILRPVAYAVSMAYYSQKQQPTPFNPANPTAIRRSPAADWRPWLLGIGIELLARQLHNQHLETSRPGGTARGLTQLEREELRKRNWALSWWAMRGAFYDNVTKGVVQGFAHKLRGRFLLDMVGNVVEDYEFLWDQYYFPTATL
ncbi:hypothetical protein MBLNU230_g7661t1 [Neophaeotheca triangularis]